MKVWIVFYCIPFEGEDLVDVFAKKNIAEEKARSLNDLVKEYDKSNGYRYVVGEYDVQDS